MDLCAGLTSRPEVDRQADGATSNNPYSLAFQAQMVLELCNLWGCQRVVLVGHSDGALLALRAAALAARYFMGQARSDMHSFHYVSTHIEKMPPVDLNR